MVLIKKKTTGTSTNIIENGPGEVGVIPTGIRVHSEEPFVEVPIYRANGSSGKVSVEWFLREDTAIAGSDFRDCSGVAYFEDGQTKSVVRVDLLRNSDFGKDQEKRFNVELGSADGGCTLGCYETTITLFKSQGRS